MSSISIVPQRNEGSSHRALDLRIHHIGYAVQSIDEQLRSWVPLFEPQSVSSITEDPIQRVRVVFIEIPGGRLELIEPTDPGSPVRQILARKRGGLYHVCYTTPRFDDAIRQFTASGYRLLSPPAPATAFLERRIVFLMTPEFDVIELLDGGGKDEVKNNDILG